MEHEEEINVEYNILYPVHLLGYIYYQLMMILPSLLLDLVGNNNTTIKLKGSFQKVNAKNIWNFPQ